MNLPELVGRNAERSLTRFCESNNRGESHLPRLRYSVNEDICILWQLASRSGELEREHPLAQLRYHDSLGQWTLHYLDAEGRWRLYLNSGPTLDIDKLLRHLQDDPFQFFQT